LSTLLTWLATCFVHIAALAMTAIMLFHLRSKYTAVGRKEICLFFYIYVFVELLAIFLDSTVIPTAHAVYPWFTAVYAGAVGALYWCIMVNGFVGFQLYEDGTPFSLWVSHVSGVAVVQNTDISHFDYHVWQFSVSASLSLYRHSTGTPACHSATPPVYSSPTSSSL
jgi:hypothetical protein